MQFALIFMGHLVSVITYYWEPVSAAMANPKEEGENPCNSVTNLGLVQNVFSVHVSPKLHVIYISPSLPRNKLFLSNVHRQCRKR